MHYRDRVYCHYRSMQGVALGEEILVRAWFCSRQVLAFCDSQSAIHLDKNSTFHSRSKHIDLLKLAKVHTDDNGADMMTRVLARGNFETCCEIVRLGITFA
ncbi:hypothetical protein CR513_04626, partial [Mucuna pruriens]